MSTMGRHFAAAVFSFTLCILVAGCASSESRLRDSLVGKWTQSTDPALAKRGLTVEFLPSGEFQAQSVFKPDFPTTPITFGGNWRVEGQTVILTTSTVGQPGISVNEMRWHVKSAGKEKLEYVVEETNKAVTLFRVE